MSYKNSSKFVHPKLSNKPNENQKIFFWSSFTEEHYDVMYHFEKYLPTVITCWHCCPEALLVKTIGNRYFLLHKRNWDLNIERKVQELTELQGKHLKEFVIFSNTLLALRADFRQILKLGKICRDGKFTACSPFEEVMSGISDESEDVYFVRLTRTKSRVVALGCSRKPPSSTSFLEHSLPPTTTRVFTSDDSFEFEEIDWSPPDDRKSKSLRMLRTDHINDVVIIVTDRNNVYGWNFTKFAKYTFAYGTITQLGYRDQHVAAMFGGSNQLYSLRMSGKNKGAFEPLSHQKNVRKLLTNHDSIIVEHVGLADRAVSFSDYFRYSCLAGLAHLSSIYKNRSLFAENKEEMWIVEIMQSTPWCLLVVFNKAPGLAFNLPQVLYQNLTKASSLDIVIMFS